MNICWKREVHVDIPLVRFGELRGHQLGIVLKHVYGMTDTRVAMRICGMFGTLHSNCEIVHKATPSNDPTSGPHDHEVERNFWIADADISLFKHNLQCCKLLFI